MHVVLFIFFVLRFCTLNLNVHHGGVQQRLIWLPAKCVIKRPVRQIMQYEIGNKILIVYIYRFFMGKAGLS